MQFVIFVRVCLESHSNGDYNEDCDFKQLARHTAHKAVTSARVRGIQSATYHQEGDSVGGRTYAGIGTPCTYLSLKVRVFMAWYCVDECIRGFNRSMGLRND